MIHFIDQYETCSFLVFNPLHVCEYEYIFRKSIISSVQIWLTSQKYFTYILEELKSL